MPDLLRQEKSRAAVRSINDFTSRLSSACSKETPSRRCLGSWELTETVLETNWNKELSVRIASVFSHHHSLQVQYCANQIQTYRHSACRV